MGPDAPRDFFGIDYSMIPRHCLEGVRAYVERGRPTGEFLRRVFENDLARAAAHADMVNRDRLYDYGLFLHYHAPDLCHGSPEAVDRWIRLGGLAGLRVGAVSPGLVAIPTPEEPKS